MEIYLILKPDTPTTTNRPFGFSYDKQLPFHAGFRSEELARYFISVIVPGEGFEPKRIDLLPPEKLENCSKVIIFETEANIDNIFSGKIKTLIKKAKNTRELMPPGYR